MKRLSLAGVVAALTLVGCADDCTAPRAYRCAGERPLLGRVHLGAAGQGQRRHHPGEDEPSHRALRGRVVSCGQGYFSAKFINMPSTAG